jgi:hypothetical protein
MFQFRVCIKCTPKAPSMKIINKFCLSSGKKKQHFSEPKSLILVKIKIQAFRKKKYYTDKQKKETG